MKNTDLNRPFGWSVAGRMGLQVVGRPARGLLARGLLVLTLLATTMGGLTFVGRAVAQDELSKFLLIKLSREQSKVLCTSETFTQCMGFSETICFELSEKALQQCIVPLPDTIKLSELDNSVIEACPQDVYAEAGYGDNIAVECLKEALGN